MNVIPFEPTESFAVVPTRLFEDETSPEIPALLSAQVIAPARVAAPLFHLELKIATLLPSVVNESSPTKSPTVVPTKLLAELINPKVPVASSNQVTAPRLPFQRGLITRRLPLNRFAMPSDPKRSPAALPSRLLLVVSGPVSAAAAVSIQVNAPAFAPQSVVWVKYLPEPRLMKKLLPTRSSTAEPTRLLLLDTSPVIPVAASTNVIAPARVAAPLFQFGVRNATRLLSSSWKVLPTRSPVENVPAVVPTRLLLELTWPAVMVAISNQVTAPLLPPQLGLRTM